VPARTPPLPLLGMTPGNLKARHPPCVCHAGNRGLRRFTTSRADTPDFPSCRTPGAPLSFLVDVGRQPATPEEVAHAGLSGRRERIAGDRCCLLSVSPTWTTTDIPYLREHASLGAHELAERMDRSPAAVKRRQDVEEAVVANELDRLAGQPEADVVGGALDADAAASACAGRGAGAARCSGSRRASRCGGNSGPTS
jgi:hypothetical protein